MNTKVFAHDSHLVSLFKKIYSLLIYMRKGHFDLIWDELQKRLYSRTISVGLRRDITQDFIPPDAAIDITIRPLQDQRDLSILKDGNMEQKFPKIVKERRELVNTKIPQCYVAVTNDNTPCYMQWLIGPQHNQLINMFFGESFPDLNSNEALLEGAFMSYSFRGKGIVPAAMSRITNEATKLGVRWVLTFVDIKNIPSLKGCSKAGFSPYIIKKDEWLFFRRKVSFEALSPKILENYKTIVGHDKKSRPRTLQTR